VLAVIERHRHYPQHFHAYSNKDCLPMSLRHSLICLALTGFLSTAYAGFDEGLAAYKLGDFKTTVRELLPLAEQGDARAQSGLAMMYDKGQGVVQDYKEAYAWSSVAAANGSAYADMNRDTYAKKLTPNQLEKGQALAKLYFEKYQPEQ
jgi:TPR repeat protein